MFKTASALALLWLSAAPAQTAWVDLFNGKNLDGWQVVGESLWSVVRDGTLVGQRDLQSVLKHQPLLADPQQYRAWLYNQSWLYTTRSFGEFDLRLDYWLRWRGNSGVSIRDTSRARYAVSRPADFNRTPSKIGYEIQISNGYPDQYPTGSIYTFVKAKEGAQVENNWNTLEIESRNDRIRVKVNGQVVAEHPGDPARAKTGPIGLQLHDQFSVAMFRNIRIREIRR